MGLADLFPVSCLPYPAPYPPPLRQQLHAHAHPFTPLLLLWNPQTLLGLLSIPEAMHSSGQHISQSGCHPAPPVSLPPLHLHHFAPLAAPPLPRRIAWLAFHRQQQEEKKENRETRMFPRLR